MYNDPIVEEIHRIREELAERFNYDLDAICEEMRKRQAQREQSKNAAQPQDLEANTNRTDAA